MNTSGKAGQVKRARQGSHCFPLFIMLLMAVLLSGCAASRSELAGVYRDPAQSNAGAKNVSVFFLFHHESQQHGFDALPKVNAIGVKDFDNIFRDALGEISNISEYATFTEFPTDVNAPERRKEKETLRETHDYTIDITFFEESSFKQQFLSGTISLLSLTLIPMPYSWDYTITAKVYDEKGTLLKTYEREATLNNWVEVLLMFAYPFHPIEGKRESIYVEALHDIFKQIESEKVLK